MSMVMNFVLKWIASFVLIAILMEENIWENVKKNVIFVKVKKQFLNQCFKYFINRSSLTPLIVSHLTGVGK
jgi:hypothetical protein